MDYQVYTPPLELSPFVKCFWSLENDPEPVPVRQRVVPDGCMELIIHYGDPYRQYFEDGSSKLQPRSFIYGQINSFLEITATGRSGIIAARFLPDGLNPFLKIPVASLDDKAEPLSTLFGAEAGLLESRVIDAKDNLERKAQMEQFLLSQLLRADTVDGITKSCVALIFQTQGRISVSELANKMNIHQRNMERRFNHVVGLSPKQLARMMRLQAALKMLCQKKSGNLTSIAHETGYFDQAHFIKDFKEFTGQSPKSFYADNLQLSTLFSGTD